MDGKPRLFIDMDGTLALWRNIDLKVCSSEQVSAQDLLERLNMVLYSPWGYFRRLPANQNVVESAFEIATSGLIDTYIASCVLPDKGNVSPRRDKNAWIDAELPGAFPMEKRIFVPDGEVKADYIPFGIGENDFLLDDYTKNLSEWQAAGGTGIKLLNGVNASKGTWKGACVSYASPPEVLTEAIMRIVLEHEEVFHDKPESKPNRVYFEDLIEQRDGI